MTVARRFFTILCGVGHELRPTTIPELKRSGLAKRSPVAAALFIEADEVEQQVGVERLDDELDASELEGVEELGGGVFVRDDKELGHRAAL